MDPSNLEEVKQPKLLLVEGKEDCQFFVKLIDCIGLNRMFVWGVNGKGNFARELHALSKVHGWNKLTHLGIIRDQDQDNAAESIQNLLRDMGFDPLPSSAGVLTDGHPRVGYWIVPRCLENLCLETVRNHPEMDCVNQYFDCLSGKSIRPGNRPKAESLVYLAAQPETVNSIGLAAEKSYWNLNSPTLDGLKSFLGQFR
jgi:hypothetical protein